MGGVQKPVPSGSSKRPGHSGAGASVASSGAETKRTGPPRRAGAWACAPARGVATPLVGKRGEASGDPAPATGVQLCDLQGGCPPAGPPPEAWREVGGGLRSPAGRAASASRGSTGWPRADSCSCGCASACACSTAGGWVPCGADSAAGAARPRGCEVLSFSQKACVVPNSGTNRSAVGCAGAVVIRTTLPAGCVWPQAVCRAFCAICTLTAACVCGAGCSVMPCSGAGCAGQVDIRTGCACDLGDKADGTGGWYERSGCEASAGDRDRCGAIVAAGCVWPQAVCRAFCAICTLTAGCSGAGQVDIRTGGDGCVCDLGDKADGTGGWYERSGCEASAGDRDRCGAVVADGCVWPQAVCREFCAICTLTAACVCGAGCGAMPCSGAGCAGQVDIRTLGNCVYPGCGGGCGDCDAAGCSEAAAEVRRGDCNGKGPAAAAHGAGMPC